MNRVAISKEARQELLKRRLQDNPFLTDEDLATEFQVSVQTIRLDRMTLGIPELRQRTKEVAERVYSQVKSIETREIVGDLLDLELDRGGLSVLETTEDMAFARTRIVRSHYIFAQAESLALAVVNAEVALTGLAYVKYRRPVRAGERLVARAEIIRTKGQDKSMVLVITKAGQDQVFRAKFLVFKVDKEEVAGESSR